MFIPVLQQLSTFKQLWVMITLGIQLGATLLILKRTGSRKSPQSTLTPPADESACAPPGDSPDER